MRPPVFTHLAVKCLHGLVKNGRPNWINTYLPLWKILHLFASPKSLCSGESRTKCWRWIFWTQSARKWTFGTRQRFQESLENAVADDFFSWSFPEYYSLNLQPVKSCPCGGRHFELWARKGLGVDLFRIQGLLGLLRCALEEEQDNGWTLG